MIQNEKYLLAPQLFSVGKHKEGWQALFQARVESAVLGASLRRFPDKELFNNQPPPAKIHIHYDAGYGDNFALLRYLPLLRKFGYEVRYETKATVVKLIRDSLDVEVIKLKEPVIIPSDTGLNDFDYHLPIIDLPFIAGTDIDSIPWRGPYLKADSGLSKKHEIHKGKIGLCWSAVPWVESLDTGTEKENYRHGKSIPFEQLKPLIDLDPSWFVAVQQGASRLKNHSIVDCLPRDERSLTWADTAALIENLDLIITIDTSVAHLAGAMGKPVWLMMHKQATSWQFMAECPGASWNTSSPWYPSMRIFRQKNRGDWGSVVDNIVTELEFRNKKVA